MGWPTLQASIDLALRFDSEKVKLVFLGGEPLLEFDKIRKAVAYIGQVAPTNHQIEYHISTNGLLIDDGVADFLEEHQFEVQLSFDGVKEAQDLRAKGTFRVIDALLAKLRRNRPDFLKRHVRVCMTLVPAAIPYLSASVRYLVDQGVSRIGISPSLIHHPDWAEDRTAELDRQFAEIYRYSLELFRQTGDIPVLCLRRSARQDGSRPANEAMCVLASGRRLAVDVDGQVYGCASLVESYQEFPSDLLRSCVAPLRLGDLHDPGFEKRRASFPEAVSSSALFYHKGKKHSSYGRCSECPYFGPCSVCPMSIGYDPHNTDPHRVPDFICAFNRIALGYRSRFPPMPSLIERLEAFLNRLPRQPPG